MKKFLIGLMLVLPVMVQAACYPPAFVRLTSVGTIRTLSWINQNGSTDSVWLGDLRVPVTEPVNAADSFIVVGEYEFGSSGFPNRLIGFRLSVSGSATSVQISNDLICGFETHFYVYAKCGTDSAYDLRREAWGYSDPLCQRISLQTFLTSQIPDVDDTTDAYLQWESFIGKDISTDGVDVYADGASICGVFGPENLVIEVDSLNGVYVQPVSPYAGSMYIEDYYTYKWKNVCTGEEFEDSKEYFQLVSGNYFPFELATYEIDSVKDANGVFLYISKLDTTASESEWEHIIQYGTPDTALAHVPDAVWCSPYWDHKTCVTKGRSDEYTNHYHLQNVPDGVYLTEEAINLPPKVFDPGVWPNFQTRYVEKRGNFIILDPVLPLCCTLNIPNPPATVRAESNEITWPVDANVDSCIVQRFFSNGSGAQREAAHASVKIPNTGTFTDITVPRKNQWYVWGVKSKNCKGTSTDYKYSNPQRISK